MKLNNIFLIIIILLCVQSMNAQNLTTALRNVNAALQDLNNQLQGVPAQVIEAQPIQPRGRQLRRIVMPKPPVAAEPRVEARPLQRTPIRRPAQPQVEIVEAQPAPEISIEGKELQRIIPEMPKPVVGKKVTFKEEPEIKEFTKEPWEKTEEPLKIVDRGQATYEKLINLLNAGSKDQDLITQRLIEYFNKEKEWVKNTPKANDAEVFNTIQLVANRLSMLTNVLNKNFAQNPHMKNNVINASRYSLETLIDQIAILPNDMMNIETYRDKLTNIVLPTIQKVQTSFEILPEVEIIEAQPTPEITGKELQRELTKQAILPAPTREEITTPAFNAVIEAFNNRDGYALYDALNVLFSRESLYPSNNTPETIAIKLVQFNAIVRLLLNNKWGIRFIKGHFNYLDNIPATIEEAASKFSLEQRQFIYQYVDPIKEKLSPYYEPPFTIR